MNDTPLSTRTLVVMVTIYYVIASLAAGIFGILQPATHIPEIIIQITQFGPALALAVVLLLFRGRRRPIVAAGLSLESFIVRRLLVAAGLVVAIFAVCIAWFMLMGKAIDYSPIGSLSQPFWIIVIAQFIGAAGEEIGWRSFLQPNLQTKMSVLASSITVGILWGIWHIGIFSEGWAFAGAFVLMAVSLSVIMGELLRDARGNNLLVAAAFHALINLGLLLFFTEESGDVYSMTTIAVVSLLAAIGTVVFNRRRATSRGLLSPKKGL